MLQFSHVVTSRYDVSTYVYQLLGSNDTEENRAEVRAMHMGIAIPDVTIVLFLTPRASARRIAARGAPQERYEGIAYIRHVMSRYVEMVNVCRKEEPGRHFVFVDATLSPRDVAQSIISAINKLV